MESWSQLVIVEDDAIIRTLLEMALKGAGYREVKSFGRGDEALAYILGAKPDLVLLDVMLPGLDGFALAERLRATPGLSATRIIMLTARTQNEDIVRGLKAGADDYVTKPFDRQVLLARVEAVLRRTLPVTEGVELDGLKIDEPDRLVTLDGEPIKLSAGEFELLLRLVAHRGRILVRSADERTIDVQVVSLRKKLGAWSRHIETIRGIGYRVTV